MAELQDYIRVGETWRIVSNKECPECGGRVTTNSRVLVCNGDNIVDEGCGWWTKNE